MKQYENAKTCHLSFISGPCTILIAVSHLPLRRLPSSESTKYFDNHCVTTFQHINTRALRAGNGVSFLCHLRRHLNFAVLREHAATLSVSGSAATLHHDVGAHGSGTLVSSVAFRQSLQALRHLLEAPLSGPNHAFPALDPFSLRGIHHAQNRRSLRGAVGFADLLGPRRTSRLLGPVRGHFHSISVRAVHSEVSICSAVVFLNTALHSLLHALRVMLSALRTSMNTVMIYRSSK